ncbi:hypothetical protein PAXRUDRAFT_536008 [Paxillus rubicundulus Ve08.2h10]|uniref:Uncharacterized protein n=1 Tax=Paxillus rubicundulus Ve08.2h10 TaxID=930991 RepID=A0A0D0E632_9AGAM|nr:hypothetical protein PAXRUDRAFT_536008 [Paxillus rubicundulus Ve08.2h10]
MLEVLREHACGVSCRPLFFRFQCWFTSTRRSFPGVRVDFGQGDVYAEPRSSSQFVFQSVIINDFKPVMQLNDNTVDLPFAPVRPPRPPRCYRWGK